MTACIWLYKFCQIKEYFLMIYSYFIQKTDDMTFLWLFMIFHVLFKILNNVLLHFINKFEVSKIYMTACIWLYKFYQIKKEFNN